MSSSVVTSRVRIPEVCAQFLQDLDFLRSTLRFAKEHASNEMVRLLTNMFEDIESRLKMALYCHTPLHEGMTLRINTREGMVEVLDDDAEQSDVTYSATMN